MGEWSYGLLGCFDNCKLCVCTYFLPCIQAGRNAEAANQGECCTCGFVSMLGCIGIYFMAKTREAAREQKGIEGSFLMDCLISWVCPLCSIIQVARELGLEEPMAQSMVRV